ncbi:MAG: hypothetical protein B6242_06135 [Anaerolineaceae bacterium 4572_78]|nr:MAG: hypothetical protein B6242_06135 [Anaerolineaceae bacterium 4572_78]
MGYYLLEVLDPRGWRREYPLDKTIIHIGSNPGNDIHLEGENNQEIAPRHVQLISAGGGSGYRLVNLADVNVSIEGVTGGKQPVLPRSTLNLTHGDRIRISDFSLIFYGGGKSDELQDIQFSAEMTSSIQGTERTAISSAIGVTLTLSHTMLSVDEPITGSVTVRNLGKAPGVQFTMEMSGLESHCYELGAGPILFPQAEKSVPLIIKHPKKYWPLAGEHRFSVRVSAPEEYPGNSVTVAEVIEILPYYHHKMRLLVEI